MSIRPPAKTRSIWQSSTERQETEKSCLRKVKQRWLSLDMANRQNERRPADVHLRAEGNREQVAESEKSLKVWRPSSKSQAGGKMVNEAEDSIVTEIQAASSGNEILGSRKLVFLSRKRCPALWRLYNRYSFGTCIRRGRHGPECTEPSRSR